MSNNELKYLFSPIASVIERHSEFIIQQPAPIVIDDGSMEYHLIGEKHMRYFGFALIEYFQGNLIQFDTNSSKLDQFRWKNIQFNFSSYSELMISLAERVCNSKSATQASTLVLQAGSWDLTAFNAMIIAESQFPKVLNFFNKVNENVSFCPRLKHIVWLTTVPHPLCFESGKCEEARGGRNNAIIRILNSHYTTFIAETKWRSDLKVSIIDAFSVIAPRLILPQHEEIICNCHYICGIINRKNALELFHTPGGDAVLQLILHALSVV